MTVHSTDGRCNASQPSSLGLSRSELMILNVGLLILSWWRLFEGSVGRPTCWRRRLLRGSFGSSGRGWRGRGAVSGEGGAESVEAFGDLGGPAPGVVDAQFESAGCMDQLGRDVQHPVAEGVAASRSTTCSKLSGQSASACTPSTSEVTRSRFASCRRGTSAAEFADWCCSAGAWSGPAQNWGADDGHRRPPHRRFGVGEIRAAGTGAALRWPAGTAGGAGGRRGSARRGGPGRGE